MAEQFYIGETIVAAFRLYTVDPVTGAKTPQPSASEVVIRFKNPSGSVLVEKSLAGGGVVNGGSGYYHASAVPTLEGLHQVEMEVGSGINQGRSEIKFGVSPF